MFLKSCFLYKGFMFSEDHTKKDKSKAAIKTWLCRPCMGPFLESPGIELLIVKSKTKELEIRISKKLAKLGWGRGGGP